MIPAKKALELGYSFKIPDDLDKLVEVIDEVQEYEKQITHTRRYFGRRKDVRPEIAEAVARPDKFVPDVVKYFKQVKETAVDHLPTKWIVLLGVVDNGTDIQTRIRKSFEVIKEHGYFDYTVKNNGEEVRLTLDSLSIKEAFFRDFVLFLPSNVSYVP